MFNPTEYGILRTNRYFTEIDMKPIADNKVLVQIYLIYYMYFIFIVSIAIYYRLNIQYNVPVWE